MKAVVLVVALVAFAAVAVLAQGPPPGRTNMVPKCTDLKADRATCLESYESSDMEACVFCVAKAISSTCCSTTQSNALPPGSFTCFNSTAMAVDEADAVPSLKELSMIIDGQMSKYQVEEKTVEADPTGPCCKVCTEPLEKYYSVDHGLFHAPFCGETCLDPSKYSLYKLFEPNLTKAVEFPENTCAHQYTPDGRFYAAYNSTVTHGVPGILSVTLDLYGPL